MDTAKPSETEMHAASSGQEQGQNTEGPSAEAAAQISEQAGQAAPEAVLTESPERERPQEQVQAPQEAVPPGAAAPSASSSGAERCFALFAAAAPLILILLWLVQSIPALLGRSLHGLHAAVGQAQLFFPVPAPLAEVAAPRPLYAFVLDALASLGGSESLGGVVPAIADFFAVNRLSGELAFPALYQPEFMPLAAALASLLLLLLTWGLALVTGYGKRTALAAACVFFILNVFAGLPAIAGEALFSTALITASLLCLYSGWIRPFAPLRLCLGFTFAALSTLSAGLPGLVLPLLTSLLFLLWRGTFRRAGARDGALGFGLMLVILLARAAYLALWSGSEGQEALRLFVDSAFLTPLALAWEMRGSGWWLVFPTLLLLWLPFPLLLPFLHWERSVTLSKSFFRNRVEQPGHGFIWAALLACLLTFSLLGVGAPLLVLPALVPLAVLSAQGLMNLATACSKLFFLLISLLLLLLAILFAAGGLYPLITGNIHPALAALYAVPAPDAGSLHEMLIQAAICLVFALLLFKLTDRRFPGGSLLVLTLFAACLTLPLTWRPLTATVSAPAVSPAPEQAAPATAMPEADETPASAPAQNSIPSPALEAAPEVTPDTAPDKTPGTAPEAGATPAGKPSQEQAAEPAKEQGKEQATEAPTSAPSQAQPQALPQPAPEKAMPETATPETAMPETATPEKASEKTAPEKSPGDAPLPATRQTPPAAGPAAPAASR